VVIDLIRPEAVIQKIPVVHSKNLQMKRIAIFALLILAAPYTFAQPGKQIDLKNVADIREKMRSPNLAD